jgi:hypothetical protein
MISHLHRAAAHEGAHSALAVISHLPVKRVWISDNGDGRAEYAHLFTAAEAETWVINALAGAEGEMLLCNSNSAAGQGDIDAIRAMTRRMGIRFLDLDAAQSKARKLVRLHRTSIEAVADVLIERRSLSGAEIAALVHAAAAAPA